MSREMGYVTKTYRISGWGGQGDAEMKYAEMPGEECNSCSQYINEGDKIYIFGSLRMCRDCILHGEPSPEDTLTTCSWCWGSGKSQRWVPPESDLDDCSRCGGSGKTSAATAGVDKTRKSTKTIREKLGIA